MRILLITFLLFLSFSAFSQGPVDRIELGYQSTRRGIVWVRPGLPTHEPVWRISRDTNAILWHNLTTGIRYDWNYDSETWHRKDLISQTLPPLESLTSGLATIDNTTSDWINDAGILHFYDNSQSAWIPHRMSYQSAAPANVAAGVSNGAAVYTTTLWQDSDDFLIRFWDGDSWELIGGGTDLAFSGASSPVTLNSSTGTDVTITAGTNISLAATGTNLTINNTGAAALSGVVNQVPYFNTSTTITTESGSGANSIYWNPTTNRMSIGSTGGTGVLNVEYPGGFTFDRAIEFTNSGGWTNRWIEMYAAGTGSRGFSFGGQNNVGADVDNVLVISPWPSGRVAINKDPSVNALNYSFEVAGATDTDGLVVSRSGSPTDAAMFNINSSGDGILRTKSGFWTLGDLDIAIGSQDPSAILHLFGPTGASTDPIFKMEKVGGFGTGLFELGYSGGEKFIHISNGTTRAITVESNNPETVVQVGINQTAPAQTLHVQGTARITASDGTATGIMGRDGDGDISAVGLGSGLSITSGTLNVSGIPTDPYIRGGNSFGGASRIGLNDNNDLVIETNGTDRVWFDNGGTVSIGTTQLTTAALNISGLQNNIGMHVAGGTGLTGPVFLQTRGTGSGSDCTVLDAQHFFTSGNVVALVQNTSTTGTGGVVVSANAKTGTGDPRFHLEIDGTTDWSIGIDNDDVDGLKLHRFASPSDNNGVGTIEFGYDGTSIGMAINKVGVGTATNAHYVVDALGKIRGDQFVNNDPGIVTTGTFALGTAAGTSPTLDSGVSEFWGNGGRLKFTSGTSPTTNGIICTVTLGTEYNFSECAPIMQGRTTNTGGFDYVGTFNSGTRVITFTLIGTLAASTAYDFNVIVSGHN